MCLRCPLHSAHTALWAAMFLYVLHSLQPVGAQRACALNKLAARLYFQIQNGRAEIHLLTEQQLVRFSGYVLFDFYLKLHSV